MVFITIISLGLTCPKVEAAHGKPHPQGCTEVGEYDGLVNIARLLLSFTFPTVYTKPVQDYLSNVLLLFSFDLLYRPVSTGLHSGRV